jgi:hypothetical protein
MMYSARSRDGGTVSEPPPGYGQQPQQPYPQQPYPPPGYPLQGYPPPGYPLQGYPPGYPAPYGGYLPQRPTNTLAIIALVLAFVFAPAAIVCGIIARKQIRQSGESGDGMALAAVIVGAVATGLMVLVFIGWLVALVVFLTTASHLPGPTPSPTF